MPLVLQGKPTHESLEPLLWLMGKWHANSAQGSFPTMPPFTYEEEVEFYSTGQPMLNYASFSWNPEKNSPLHSEAGYLRIKLGSPELSFMVAHNFGLTSIEEGQVSGKSITLSSQHISRMSWSKAPAVSKIVRTWTLREDNKLEQVLSMETENTPLSEHLRVLYTKMY